MFSRVKWIFFAALAAFLAVHRCDADMNSAWEKDIAALGGCASLGTTLQLWNDQIVVRGSKFYSFTAEDLTPKALVVPHLDEIVSVGDASGVPVALGKTKGKMIVVMKGLDQWRELPNLPALQKATNPMIIPSKRGLAILTDHQLFRFDDRKWLTPVSLPEWTTSVHTIYGSFQLEKWGYKQLLYGSQLFLGWNLGEDGGVLFVLDLGNAKAEWKEISGKKEGSGLGIVGRWPVSGMAIAPDSSLWVSEGLAHLDGLWMDLSHYDGGDWHSVIRESYRAKFGKPDPSVATFPSGATNFCDIFTAPDKRLYVLAGALGILALEDNALKPQISMDFYDIFLPRVNSDRKTAAFTVYCLPQRLVVDKAGNFFVGTAYFGDLCFIKAPDGYHLKQVIPPME